MRPACRTRGTVCAARPSPDEKIHTYSREQFERRTHKRLIDIIAPTQKTVEALMSLELPAGVEIEIKL